MQQCIYNHIYIIFVMNFPPGLANRQHLSGTRLLWMRWTWVLLCCNPIRPELPPKSPLEILQKWAKRGYSCRISPLFFPSFFQESHMMPWRRSWLEFVCPRIEKRWKLKATSIYRNCGSSEQTGFGKFIARTYEWHLRTIIHFCSMLCFVSSTSWGAVPWYAW